MQGSVLRLDVLEKITCAAARATFKDPKNRSHRRLPLPLSATGSSEADRLDRSVWLRSLSANFCRAGQWLCLGAAFDQLPLQAGLAVDGASVEYCPCQSGAGLFPADFADYLWANLPAGAACGIAFALERQCRDSSNCRNGCVGDDSLDPMVDF